MEISETQKEKLSELLDFVITSKKSDFYLSHFKKNGIKGSLNVNTNIDSLPFLSYENLLDCTFLKRLYINNKIYTKVIYRSGYLPILIGRTRDDIRQEPYKIPGNYPLVFFKSPHESVSKCHWLYEHNILPLINEKNWDLTLSNASQYPIDSVWSDMDSLESVATILTTLKKKELPIYVYDVSFKLELCEKFEKEFNIHFSIDLSEVGLIATACDKSSYPAKIFHPVLNIIIEIVGKRLVVTQLIPLPTPIIKYKINAGMMVAKEVTHDCDCANKNYSFMLT